MPLPQSSAPMSRRTMLSVLGATGLTGLLPAPAAAMDVPRTRVGDITVTSLSDGHFDLPRAAFSPLPGAGTQKNQRVGAHAWLIETGPRRMLVDTGSGTLLRGKYPDTGHLDTALAETGTVPEDITDILITHMHVDHIGGLMQGGMARYPNAMLHLCEIEWRYWAAPERAQLVAPAQRPLANMIAGLIDQFAYKIAVHRTGSDLGAGVRLEAAPGHTPGHQIVHIDSNGQSLLLLGDALISGPLQFAHPDIQYVLDDDPALAARTRAALFDRIAADGTMFSATHLVSGSPQKLKRRAPLSYSVHAAKTI